MKILLLAAGVLALAAPAHAQATVPDEALEGLWLFEAEAFHGAGLTQEISGEMEIVRTAENEFSCRFEAIDHIPEENVWIRTDQACTAVRDGDTLVIESVVLNVDPPIYHYIPDDFTVTIRGDSLMVGVMHAGDGQQPGVTFTRGGALLS